MSTAAMTPQSTASFRPTAYNEPKRDERLKVHTDSQSSSSSHSSSPESRPVDLRSPIPEEEEEDETGSEAANEPITPTDSHHPHLHTFPDKMDGTVKSDNAYAFAPIHSQPPLILNTAATPPPSPGKAEITPVAEQQTPKSPTTPLRRKTTASSITPKDGAIKRGLSGLFKRSHSHNSSLNIQPLTQVGGAALSSVNGSDTMLGREHRRLSIRRMSATNSASTTRSNTPPSPGSPAEGDQKPLQRDPSAEDFFSNSRRKHRSATGFNIRDKISNTKSKISFVPTEKELKNRNHRHRATSVDLDSQIPDLEQDPQAKLPPRQIWGMAADSGTGLKSRRMSLNLPDDFTVDVVELYTEFTDQSKLVGRRGKHVGKGATANVRLMHRKGCAGEVYAVKEFRGKSTNEKSEDYEQKVKSEYSIAKSVHHPNVVETFRLCTHNGRWNHVMEFCDQGDLFGLVSQKYLSKEDHLVDRLCLFKQLVQGLNYLHNNGIAHRDVKLENLLITKDSKLKITDFGVSEVFAGIHPGLRAAGGRCGKEMGEIRLCAPGMCGSPPYVAPEVIAKKGKLSISLIIFRS
jgi:protein-serine/threonine kinase